MPESRRSLHLNIATLAALLGLQLASCADVQSGPDQAPPGILMPSPINRPPAPAAPAASAPRQAAPQLPITGGPQIALLLPLSGRQGAAALQVRDGFLAAYYLAAQRAALGPARV